MIHAHHDRSSWGQSSSNPRLLASYSMLRSSWQTNTDAHTLLHDDHARFILEWASRVLCRPSSLVLAGPTQCKMQLQPKARLNMSWLTIASSPVQHQLIQGRKKVHQQLLCVLPLCTLTTSTAAAILSRKRTHSGLKAGLCGQICQLRGISKGSRNRTGAQLSS